MKSSSSSSSSPKAGFFLGSSFFGSGFLAGTMSSSESANAFFLAAGSGFF
jgi:hypothetical protein